MAGDEAQAFASSAETLRNVGITSNHIMVLARVMHAATVGQGQAVEADKDARSRWVLRAIYLYCNISFVIRNGYLVL